MRTVPRPLCTSAWNGANGTRSPSMLIYPSSWSLGIMRYPRIFRYQTSGILNSLPFSRAKSILKADTRLISPLIHIRSMHPSFGRAAEKKLASEAMNAI